MGLLTVLAVTVGSSPDPAAALGTGPDYVINADQVAAITAEVEAATGQEVLSGELAGAAWIGQIPDNWNGSLLIYAHGFRGDGLDLTVDPPPAYQFLTAEGYAWAASSYRRNSYDPGVGVVDTKNVTGHMHRLLERMGGVEYTYLAGISMGGHVTGATIERYPGLYDGALPMCGVMGDLELFDYFLDYNLGAAAISGFGSDFAFPDEAWTANSVPGIRALLSTDPEGAWAGGLDQIFGAPSPLTAAGEEFKDFVEIGSGGERVTFDAAWNFWHGLADPSGNFFFSLGEGDGTLAGRQGIVSQNSDTSYLEEYGVAIDADVVRVTARSDIRAGEGIQPAPVITGNLPVPVLSIHTTGDLFVPIEMQQIYAQEAAANGVSDLLVQRSMRDVGHCTFTGDEFVQSYTDLFAWVEDGVVPEGEDLIADISSPSLGCAWTTGEGGTDLRAALEPCPEE